MENDPAVLRERLCEGERIQLHIWGAVCKTFEQCCDRAACTGEAGSALVKRRIKSADANPASPSSCTLSQRLRTVSQSSPVRFSSVAFAVCAVGVIRRTKKGSLTDEIIVRRWLRASEHDRRGRWLAVCAWIGRCCRRAQRCGGDATQ